MRRLPTACLPFSLLTILLIAVAFRPPLYSQSTTSLSPDTCGGAATNREGLRYLRGEGVPKDDWKALQLFKKAADGCDNADAFANLGYMYQTGAAVPRDPYRAKQFYEKAVALGSVEGLTRLGEWYTGSFPVPDYTRARMLLEKAAAQGSRTAEFSLGNASVFGQWGIPRDGSQAIAWFKKVVDTPPADYDDPALTVNAAESIGAIYQGLAGIPRDDRAAFPWFQRAADLGDPRAMKQLSQMYRYGWGVQQDPQLAQEWGDKAAEADGKQAAPAVATKRNLCKAEQLDSTLSIDNAQNQSFTIGVETRNLSAHACRLDYVDARFMGEPPVPHQPLQRIHVELCQGCDALGHAGRPRAIKLGPNQVAHADISWASVADPNGSPCVAMGWMSVGFNLTAAPLGFHPGFPGIPICSTVNVGQLTPGPDPHAEREVARVASLKIVAPKATYFPREHMLLQVSATQAGILPSSGESCPFLLQRIRYPSGAIKYLPLAGDPRCKVVAVNPRDSRLEVTLLANVYRELGDYDLQLLQYAPPDSKHAWRLVAESDKFRYRINDSYKVERSWGPEVKGLAASVTLDKATYAPGEDVPLHLALKNISVPDRSFHIQICTDAVITVRDELGHKIESADDEEFCSQNGTTNPYFPPGDILPTEHSLKLMGLLPTKPGTYTIESTWTMYPRPPGPNGLFSQAKDAGPPYAIVSSAPVTFRVADTPQN